MAKMLAEPLRMALGTMAEMLLAGSLWRRCWRSRCGLAGAAVAERLQRGSAVAKMLAEPMRIADAAPERIAYAAGSKERKQITACRNE